MSTSETEQAAGIGSGCPQPGSGGVHSRRYYDEDRVCSWCGEKRTQDIDAWRCEHGLPFRFFQCWPGPDWAGQNTWNGVTAVSVEPAMRAILYGAYGRIPQTILAFNGGWMCSTPEGPTLFIGPPLFGGGEPLCITTDL